MLHNPAAFATPLSVGKQLGVSRVSFPTGFLYDPWRVWAGRTDGNLVALETEGNFGAPPAQWTDFGQITARPVGPQGVSATSWWNQATQIEYERAYYVNADFVVEIALENGVSVLQRAIAGPAGKTLTSYFAVSRRYSAALNRNYTLVYATVKDAPNSTSARLYVLQIDTTNNAATWYALGTQNDYSTTLPIAASNSPDGVYSRVFATTTAVGQTLPDRLRHVRWDGALARVLDLGQPQNVPICSTIAAAEGDLGGPAGYRVYVFCTKRFAGESAVRFRHASGQTADNIANWGPNWLSTTTSSAVKNSEYSLAATYRSVDKRIHAFALASDGRLFAASTPSGGGLLSSPMTYLGDDGEYATRSGGLAATPAHPGPNGYPHLYYFGPNAAAGRLYRVVGDPLKAPAWTNHGSSTGQGMIVDSMPATEPFTAFYRNHVASVFMRALDNSAPTHSHWAWSTDQGETWEAPHELPTGTVDFDPGLPFVSNMDAGDPTLGFTDNGTAYALLLGSNRAGNCGGAPSGTRGSEVFLVKSTDFGANYSALQIDRRCSTCPLSGSSGTGLAPDGKHILDRPGLAVEQRGSGQADYVHMVWSDRDGPGFRIRYARASDPVNVAPQSFLLGKTSDATPVTGGVPVVSVGAQGAVYVGWNAGLCRIDWNTWSSCIDFRNWQNEEVSQGAPGGLMRIPPYDSDEQWVTVVGQVAIVASRVDPNIVYYAFQRVESDGDELDVYFQVIEFDPVTNSFPIDQSAPIRINATADDDIDQFMPEPTLTDDDRVFVTWYDREACNGQLNNCFRSKRAVLRTNLLSFGYEQEIQINAADDPSDPLLLPARCGELDGAHFLGDYHHVQGDHATSFHTVVGAPLGGPGMTADLVRGWVSPGFYYWPWN